MTIQPGSDEERRLLGRWIRKGQGLIVAGSALGESYIDPKVKREGDAAAKSEEYVKLDREIAEKLPHLKGKFRYELEKYFRDRWGPYLPKER
ncbi:MAG: hypothetical protein HZA02_08790 [Nitrospinae bacterium]|nr:hypothetical protein [Nitrospinota bacterium]